MAHKHILVLSGNFSQEKIKELDDLWTDIQLDRIAVFPTIHLDDNQLIYFIKVPKNPKKKKHK